ncbi:MAG: DNA methylase [Chloroflexi bacterium]|nr:DNA methylase [Chloroflexota bacterium]
MKNELNDLTNTEWMISTKSVWLEDESIARIIQDVALRFQEWLKKQEDKDILLERLEQPLPSVLLSTPPQRDDLKIQHPATFAESDIARLILFFTKEGELVLDPFLGSGSTCIAAIGTGRRSIGVELVDKWAGLAQERINRLKYTFQLPLLPDNGNSQQTHLEATVLRGDARVVLKSMETESIDFIVTSPPYWGILNKRADHKVKAERLSKNLPTRYSDQHEDLGNITEYDEFISSIGVVMRECFRLLRPKKYACIIVSDFRHKSRFVAHHTDISREMEKQGYSLEGITILVQNSKSLYPYGIPYAFVSNVHHQYVLVFRKPSVT